LFGFLAHFLQWPIQGKPETLSNNITSWLFYTNNIELETKKYLKEIVKEEEEEEIVIKKCRAKKYQMRQLMIQNGMLKEKVTLYNNINNSNIKIGI
jgi:hypothetical protein